jgi:hypothetical protein
MALVPNLVPTQISTGTGNSRRNSFRTIQYSRYFSYPSRIHVRQLHQNIKILLILGGVRLSPLGTAATIGLLYQPQIINDGDCGAVAGIKIGRGNRSTRSKPVPVSLCPPQISHDLTRARTRAAAVGSQRLTAWAMAQPCCSNLSVILNGEMHDDIRKKPPHRRKECSSCWSQYTSS